MLGACKRYEEILFRLISTFYFFSIESGVIFYKKEIDTRFWNTLSIFLKVEYSSKFMLYPKYLQLSSKLCQHPLKHSIRSVLISDSDTWRDHTCWYMATSFIVRWRVKRLKFVENRVMKLASRSWRDVRLSKLRFASEDISLVLHDPHTVLERERAANEIPA